MFKHTASRRVIDKLRYPKVTSLSSPARARTWHVRAAAVLLLSCGGVRRPTRMRERDPNGPREQVVSAETTETTAAADGNVVAL